jgi:hypothetical protein
VGTGQQKRVVVVVGLRESNALFAFNYMSAFVNSLVTPIFNGWTTGGSTVKVSGDYFAPNGLLRCRLNVVGSDTTSSSSSASASASSSLTSSVVEETQLATFIDTHTLSCPLPRVPTSVRGEVEVSNDGGVQWGGSTDIHTNGMLFPSGGGEPLGDELVEPRTSRRVVEERERPVNDRERPREIVRT